MPMPIRADDSLTILKQKRLGQSIKVSDFIEECSNDYLKYNDEYARLLLETQTDDYFGTSQVSFQVRVFLGKNIELSLKNHF